MVVGPPRLFIKKKFSTAAKKMKIGGRGKEQRIVQRAKILSKIIARKNVLNNVNK